MADIVKISPNNFSFQSYQGKDTSLMSQFDVNSFISETSYIEFFVYNQNNTILNSNLNYRQYDVLNDGQSAGNNNQISQFNISPEVDIANAGFNTGEYVAYYNFLVKQVGDNFSNFFISEISSDRTEIRLDSNTLSGLEIKNQTGDFITFRENQDYFVDFYLNFGNNNLIIANNIKLENPKTSNATVLIKLYEPLPSEFDLKDNLWIVTTLNEPEAFRVTYPIETTSFTDTIQIQGPNYNIPVKNQVNNSSENLSYSDIINGASTSSMDQVNSLLEETSINISVDYSDFSEFIHFSSAQTRIENFEYKVKLIESYNSELNSLTNITSSDSSITPLKAKISDIIKNFDKFEYFMYYSSGSITSWPKSTTELPYVLYPSTSSQVLTWIGSVDEQNSNYGGLLLSSSYYDNANPDQLKKAIPEYLREDSANHQYDLFVDMVAQYYDNVWLYTKDVTQKYNADNRLDFGVSKELVADAIRDFGVKLYQNNFSNKELYTAFLGMTPEGSVFPFPNITGSTPVPSGYELVDVMISASNDVISMDDTNKSLYKRIYHNIPYLLNTKGTITGLRALITSYGIPDTILRISEFGGKDKVNENDWDYYFNNFNYAWNTQGTNSMFTPWEVNPALSATTAETPGTVELRFKTEGLPGSRVSQSLWFTTSSAGIDKAVILEYTGSGLTSGSYNGSIPDPYNQYGTLKYISSPGTVNEVSCSVYLPFFDGDWWSVMVRNNGFDAFDPELIITEPVGYDFIQSEDGNYIVRESSTSESFSRLGNVGLFAANKIYSGNDGTSIGFKASSSIDSANASGSWFSGSVSYFAKDFTAGSTYQNFSGSMQEVRYYNVALGTTRFYDYTMNPLSIEGNTVNSAPNELTFRTSLGGELDISTTSSIHPKSTGSWTPLDSFNSTNNYQFTNPATFNSNTEYFFLDQFPAGIKNRISDKIRYENVTLPEGNVLSPIRRLSQTVEASASYTDSINYLEVAFSPQNQINDDIISQIGYFNVGDYIGDPRQRFTGNRYKDLNALSEDYFKKYTKQYDLTDFVRLIKFFDNSLFKMIKDFIPTRTSLASGLVIKQHLLERNKYPQPQVSFESKLLTGSIDMVAVSGGAGGMFNVFNGLNTSPYGVDGTGPDNKYNITQSWEVTTQTISGSVSSLHDSQDEFYNGEFSGSYVLVTNGELNPECNEIKDENILGYLQYTASFYNTTSTFSQSFWDNASLEDGNVSFFINSSNEINALKISKIDALGANQVQTLQSAQILYFTFPDLGFLPLQIANIQDSGTSFKMPISPTVPVSGLYSTNSTVYNFTSSIPANIYSGSLVAYDADKVYPWTTSSFANFNDQYFSSFTGAATVDSILFPTSSLNWIFIDDNTDLSSITAGLNLDSNIEAAIDFAEKTMYQSAYNLGLRLNPTASYMARTALNTFLPNFPITSGSDWADAYGETGNGVGSSGFVTIGGQFNVVNYDISGESYLYALGSGNLGTGVANWGGTNSSVSDINNIYPFITSSGYSFETGLETSNYLSNKIQSNSKSIMLSESIALPPSLELVKDNPGDTFGTKIKVKKLPNTTVPITMNSGWQQFDSSTGVQHFHVPYYNTSSFSSIESPLGISYNFTDTVIPANDSGSAKWGAPYLNKFGVLPGKFYMGLFKNDVLITSASSFFYTNNVVFEDNYQNVKGTYPLLDINFISPTSSAIPFGNPQQTALVEIQTTLNDLGVEEGDILEYKVWGYSYYGIYTPTTGSDLSTNKGFNGAIQGLTQTSTNKVTVVGRLQGELIGSNITTWKNPSQSPNAYEGPLPDTIINSPDLSDFENSNCDVLQGEAVKSRSNPFLQDLDYQTSQTVPVNYDVVVSESATKATVPESYYTSPSHTNARYVGAKNQSRRINEYPQEDTSIDFNAMVYENAPASGFSPNPIIFNDLSTITPTPSPIFTYTTGFLTSSNFQSDIFTTVTASFENESSGLPTGSNVIEIKPGVMEALVNNFEDVTIEYHISGTVITNVTDPSFDPLFNSASFGLALAKYADPNNKILLYDDQYDENNFAGMDPFLGESATLYANSTQSISLRGALPGNKVTSERHVIVPYINSGDVEYYFSQMDVSLDDFQLTLIARNPTNTGTYGKTPSITTNDVNIYEFEWGGGTNPEIQGFGALRMSQILQVDDKDSVKTVNPSEGYSTIKVLPNINPPFTASLWNRNASLQQPVNDYYYIINRNNPIDTRISLNLYNNGNSSNPTGPLTTTILTTEYGVPTRSNFMLTSSYLEGSSTTPNGRLYYEEYDSTPTGTNTSGVPGLITSGPTTASFIQLYDSRTMNIVNSDYSPGTPVRQDIIFTGTSSIGGVTSIENMVPIQEQLNNGERWFITFYENLEKGFNSDALTPLHFNNSVLGKKGVVEIVGIIDKSSNNELFLLLGSHADRNTFASGSVIPSKTMERNIGLGDLGFLMWKANSAGNNEFVMIQSPASGIGKGAFTSEYAPTYLTENFQTITKTYGSNTQ